MYYKKICSILVVAALMMTAASVTSCKDDECSHTWTDGEVITAATCVAAGSVEQVCSKCKAKGEPKTIPIDLTAHQWGPEATCEAPQTCQRQGCGVTVPALGHDLQPVDGTAIAATCEENGKEADMKCSRCDHTEVGDVIEALGHDDTGEAATCTTDQVCAREGCDHVITEALGHNFVGLECSRCGEFALAAGLYEGAFDALTATSTPTTVAANNVADAVDYIKADPEEYTLLLDEDVTVSAVQNLNVSDVKLTIIGIGGERKISLTAAGRMFTVGASGQTGIELTLGANITLVGYDDNNNVVVDVQNGAALTMLDGSKITGNISSGNTDANGFGAAVRVSYAGSTFTMKGGTITGNSATNNGTYNTGGLYVTGTAILEGGSIEENTGTLGDVMITQITELTLSGTAKAGTLTMSAASATNRAALTIETGWTGSVAGLNLLGNTLYLNENIGYWANGSPLLLGDGVNATTVGQITLGDFRTTSATTTQAISPDYEINADGVLVAK